MIYPAFRKLGLPGPRPVVGHIQQRSTVGQNAASMSHGVVYFYLDDVGLQDWLPGAWGIGGLPKPSIYCDDKLLAKAARGSYFIAHLEPGKHLSRAE